VGKRTVRGRRSDTVGRMADLFLVHCGVMPFRAALYHRGFHPCPFNETEVKLAM